MQLDADRLPREIIVGVRQRLTRAPLDLAGPSCFHVGLLLANQAGKQVHRQLGALADHAIGDPHRAAEVLLDQDRVVPVAISRVSEPYTASTATGARPSESRLRLHI